MFFPPASFSAAAVDTLKELAVPYDVSPVPGPAPVRAVYPLRPIRPLKVYFLNVGQGDAAYLELPNGQNSLIDAGPYSAKTSYLASFLAEHNVTRIDNVVMTHPHADHYTGLLYVFSNLSVTNFYDTQVDNTGTAVDEAIRAKARALGVNIIHPAAGDTLDWDPAEVRVKVLNTCSDPVMSGSGQFVNNCSIVLKITYQNTSILLTGDLQEDVEAVLVNEYGSELKSDLLKVGHHGSRYSSSDAFLAAVHPGDAVISVGADNNYGHPTPLVLARLQAVSAVIHRTDVSGTMEYTITPSYSGFSFEESLASLRY